MFKTTIQNEISFLPPAYVVRREVMLSQVCVCSGGGGGGVGLPQSQVRMGFTIIHVHPDVEIEYFLEEYPNLASKAVARSHQIHLNATYEYEYHKHQLTKQKK